MRVWPLSLVKKEIEIRTLREKHQMFPRYQQVDTCAGEFESSTLVFLFFFTGQQHLRKSTHPTPLLLSAADPTASVKKLNSTIVVYARKGFRKNGKKSHYGELQSGDSFN